MGSVSLVRQKPNPALLVGIIAGAVVLLGIGYYVFRPKRDGQRLKRAGVSFNPVKDMGSQQMGAPASPNFAVDVRLAVVRSDGVQTTEADGPLVTGEEVIHE